MSLPAEGNQVGGDIVSSSRYFDNVVGVQTTPTRLAHPEVVQAAAISAIDNLPDGVWVSNGTGFGKHFYRFLKNLLSGGWAVAAGKVK